MTTRREERDGEWFRPQIQNNWEILTYAEYLIMSDWGTHTPVSDDARLSAGQVVDVRWPNGAVSAEVIEARPYSTSVSDMGHNYPVNTERMVVCTATRGQAVEIDISDLWIRR